MKLYFGNMVTTVTTIMIRSFRLQLMEVVYQEYFR